MDRALHKSNSLLNEPKRAAHAVKEEADVNHNETEYALSVQYFLQPNLPQACENIEQPESKLMFTSNKYLHKFRTAVLVVQVIRNLIKIYRDYALSRTEPLSFSEYAAFETDSDNLLFDRSFFKAKLEMVISSEVQLILTSPPDKRTAEEAKMAMLSLRATVDTFAGYPIHIQEQLAELGWYECFGPGRVIIRQGHIPQNFYLILSGTTVVTKVSRNTETGEHFSKTVAFLKKGKYFGDVAILTNAKRNATVVCHDTVSLLAISRQDFLNIFLTSESNEGPEYIKLLHNIDLLSGWPIHKLPYNNPRICLHTFYRPGTVITKDSKASSKIYMIKSGSVRVLKSMAIFKPLSSLKAYRQYTLNLPLPLLITVLVLVWLSAICGWVSFDELHNKNRINEDSPQGAANEKRTGHLNDNSVYHAIEEEYLLPVLKKNKTNNEINGANKNKIIVSPTEHKECSKITKDNISPIFIHLQTLRTGDIFGLVYIMFEDTLGMALVSDGAECIVISKDFFKKHMDEEYIQKLSRYIQPYPTDDMLQQKMQDYIKWKIYKSTLIRK